MEKIHDNDFAETVIPEYCVTSLIGKEFYTCTMY